LREPAGCQLAGRVCRRQLDEVSVGNGTEGWHGDRYGAYHDHAVWRALVDAKRFVELKHYYRPPGQPGHRQPWLATVFRRLDRAG